MNSRIRELRKELKLSQEEFGKKINLKQNSIALIESGKRNASARTINDICKEFKVNEVWLRTGEGGKDNIFVVIDKEDRFTINLAKLMSSDDQFIQNAVNYLAETNPEKLKEVESFFKFLLGIT